MIEFHVTACQHSQIHMPCGEFRQIKKEITMWIPRIVGTYVREACRAVCID